MALVDWSVNCVTRVSQGSPTHPGIELKWEKSQRDVLWLFSIHVTIFLRVGSLDINEPTS